MKNKKKNTGWSESGVSPIKARESKAWSLAGGVTERYLYQNDSNFIKNFKKVCW